MTSTQMTARKMLNAFTREAFERFDYEESKQAHIAADKIIRYCMLDVKERKTKLKESFFQKLIDSRISLDFAFINNSLRATNRFNVYAIEKALLNLKSVAQDRLIVQMNKYEIAMIVYMLQHVHDDSFVFDRKKAHAMLSLALQNENVSRHEMSQKFDVSQDTANTQTSSSFRTLEALNIVEFDDTVKARQVVSKINLDHAFVRLVARTFDIDLSDATSDADAQVAAS